MQRAVHTLEGRLHKAGVDGEVLGADDGERRERDEQSVLVHGEGAGLWESLLVGRAN